MRILCPINNIKELKPLIEEGADEFYCGVVDNISLNDRPNNSKFNLKNINELKKAVNIVKKHDKKIYLALNNISLEIKDSLKLIKKIKLLGFDGVIVANMLLLDYIKKLDLNLEVYLSCLNGVLNSETLNFFNKFSITGVHFPRHLSLKNINDLLKNKKIDYSVFIFNGMCINIESFCSMHYFSSIHLIPSVQNIMINCNTNI